MQNNAIIVRDFDSPLGPMMAGATSHGVCFLEWHDRGGTERIAARVEKRYGRPLATGDCDLLQTLADELAAYFSGQRRSFTVPTDVAGTEFERAVWRELLAIPYGETRSYGQIAAAIGKPDAQRAVGRANRANYLSILIPCHRVIEANGKLRGYGGGLWRKKWLLELESGSRAGVLPSIAGERRCTVA